MLIDKIETLPKNQITLYLIQFYQFLVTVLAIFYNFSVYISWLLYIILFQKTLVEKKVLHIQLLVFSFL